MGKELMDEETEGKVQGRRRKSEEAPGEKTTCHTYGTSAPNNTHTPNFMVLFYFLSPDNSMQRAMFMPGCLLHPDWTACKLLLSRSLSHMKGLLATAVQHHKSNKNPA